MYIHTIQDLVWRRGALVGRVRAVLYKQLRHDRVGSFGSGNVDASAALLIPMTHVGYPVGRIRSAQPTSCESTPTWQRCLFFKKSSGHAIPLTSVPGRDAEVRDSQTGGA
mmetsp:Transcript_21860/g.44156  ORF Transcript_21860/g.44156 Transcript_21860/m.44156 type:complete len:110 (+) Transcript_21860:101-430(+)